MIPTNCFQRKGIFSSNLPVVEDGAIIQTWHEYGGSHFSSTSENLIRIFDTFQVVSLIAETSQHPICMVMMVFSTDVLQMWHRDFKE